MFLQETKGIPLDQLVRVIYDCDGGFERCGKKWNLKLKDANASFVVNRGKLICKQCMDAATSHIESAQDKIKKTNIERYGVACPLNSKENIEKRSKQYEDPEFVKKVVSKRRKTSMET